MRLRQIEEVARKVSKEPDAVFRELANIGRQARMRGYYTKGEFLRICRWKSSRLMGLCQINTESEVRTATRAAFATSSERASIEALLSLRGVAIPRASALLAASNPKLYGVIDIRAWQYLHSVGEVKRNKSGRGLSVNNWLEYLPILRSAAASVGTSPRLVEIALYWAHKNKFRDQPLYGDNASNRRLQRKLKRVAQCGCVFRDI